MPNSPVIVNTSPLLYLHQVGCLELLQNLYSRILTPPAVIQELAVGKNQGINVPDINAIEWISITPVKSISLIPAVIDLGQGEAEVLALGLENPGSLLIFDDQLARRINPVLLHHVLRNAQYLAYDLIGYDEILEDGLLLPQ